MVHILDKMDKDIERMLKKYKKENKLFIEKKEKDEQFNQAVAEISLTQGLNLREVNNIKCESVIDDTSNNIPTIVEDYGDDQPEDGYDNYQLDDDDEF